MALRWTAYGASTQATTRFLNVCTPQVHVVHLASFKRALCGRWTGALDTIVTLPQA